MNPPVSENIPAIIEVSREAGRRAVSVPEIRAVDGVECQLSQSGAITPLVLPERYLNAPRRKRAKVSLYEAASFSDYVNRHKVLGATTLFGVFNETSAGFSAIIDYHGDTPSGAPAFGEHTCTLGLHITPEWSRWLANNAKFLPQAAFAEHIEDNLTDIIDPEPAALLEVAQGLQGMKNVAFKSGRNLSDGAVKLEYVETIEVSGTSNRRDGTFKVPASFRLQLVPFIGANGVELDARLRFRIGPDGSISFAYILNRPYKVIEDAFAATRDDIEKGTGLKVLLGSGGIVRADT